MESAPASPAAGDDPPRVKLLCSVGGSFLPRPLDGRLRHVGGDTRIVAVPRDASFEELLARIREVFEGASIIKYQQPEEDLDALVSVLNDDDVMNMMEECDKLSESGDGLTKLRVFLFSYLPEHDLACVDARHERETERRYVDALNRLPDTLYPPSPEMLDQYLGLPPNADGGFHNQFKMHHVNVPRPSLGQRYGEMDTPWVSAYVSPESRGGLDNHREFSNSPASSRFHLGAMEFNDPSLDEYARPAASYQLHQYDLQLPPPIENLWLPPGAIVHEKAGFPIDLRSPHYCIEGKGTCQQCHMAFWRNHGPISDARYSDPWLKHGHPHMDQQNVMNDYVGCLPSSCAECYRIREPYMLNHDIKLDRGIYVQEQNELRHHPFHNEIHDHDRGLVMHNSRNGHEDGRTQHSGIGRLNEQYVDGNIMQASFRHGNACDGHSSTTNAVNFHDRPYPHQGTEVRNEAFLDQHTVGGDSHTKMLNFEETMVQHRNQLSTYGVESLYQVPQNLPPIPSLQRKAQVPAHSGTSRELSSLMPNGGPVSGFRRHTPEGSPRFSYVQVDDQNSKKSLGQNNVMSQKNLGTKEFTASYSQGAGLIPNMLGQDSSLSPASDSVQCCPSTLHVEAPFDAGHAVLTPSYHVDEGLIACSPCGSHQPSMMGSDITVKKQIVEKKNLTEVHDKKHSEIGKEPDAGVIKNEKGVEFDLNGLRLTETDQNTNKPGLADNKNVPYEDGDISEESLSFLPELLASVKKAMLDSADEVIVKGQPNGNAVVPPLSSKKQPTQDCVTEAAIAEVEARTVGDDEPEKRSKIEPTTAETEALAKGLQTIRNDDLEEIRILGSGTYGSVYHGKWRGSDVAIKRIKASCFAGRPSERERLIADFWKEAVIMSSLHHPNVVSLYGVVRDGPDGSLATVTEFMVNGSLKQFLQKKDRTIDRRKRLIIAMDVSFGMEYLHSKNIVHFDLKCENLLVNMRDPCRPICKIGDLGLSKVRQHTLVSGGIRGTLPWMAPELLSGKSNMVSEKIDVYSFGIVMWELLTGEEPYADMRGASIIGGIVNNTLRPKIPTWCDPEWKSLMESCWSTDPALRPSFSEISQKLRKMAAAINLK